MIDDLLFSFVYVGILSIVVMFILMFLLSIVILMDGNIVEVIGVFL